MIDWMAEVLNTFKCSDQTFFLAVNIMDRYFKNADKQLQSSELHLIGVVSMFIASKYEDVIPLLMKTVISKIGHDKFSQKQIQEKEIEVLKALSYKIGAPTVKEHLDRYFEEMNSIFKVSERVKQLCMYIGKIASHNYFLMQQSTSILAVSILRIALKIQDKVEKVVEYQEVMIQVLDFSEVQASEIKECS
jgi:cyclin A